MSAFFRPVFFLRRLAVILTAGAVVASCLPDEGDVSAKYNAINQRAHVENVAGSLATSAQNMAAYYTAAEMRRKAPLQDGKIIDPTSGPTVQNNAMPTMPSGIAVTRCGKYGVMTYFTAVPKGISNLKKQGETMTSTLALRFGNDSVGAVTAGGVTMAKKGLQLGCTSPSNAVVGSPLFIAGFATPKDSAGVDLIGLPDPRKTTQPIFKRDITIPCPTGTDGVIKREQTCELKFNDTEAEKENTQIKLGAAGKEKINDVQRLTKRWDCTSDTSAPKALEIAAYCRDPAKDIAKPEDNAIELKVANLKKELETNNSEFYTFYCRKNKDGTNTCDAQPYTPPPNTQLECGSQVTPPRFVTNPASPFTVNAGGELVSENPLTDRDCGRGWKGQLIGRYMTRKCNLIKVVDGTPTVVATPQTIYHFAYAGAKCGREMEDLVTSCPAPYDGTVLVKKRFEMTQPMALDWQEYVSGRNISTSKIAGPTSRQEVKTTAANQGYFLPAVTLPTGGDQKDFDKALTSALKDVMQSQITGCNLMGQTCTSPPAPIKLMILVDQSGSMDNPGGTAAVSYRQCLTRVRNLFKIEYVDGICAALAEYQGAGGGKGNNELPEGGNPQTDVEGLKQYMRQAFVDPEAYEKYINIILNSSQGCETNFSNSIGFCFSQVDKEEQGTCPGRCEAVQTDVSGTKRVITDAQIPTILSYVPPGSTVRYAEFADTTSIATGSFCNSLDPGCNFSSEINDFKSTIRNVAPSGGSTRLLNAIKNNISFFDADDNGILILISDGVETDSCDYNPELRGFCQTTTWRDCADQRVTRCVDAGLHDIRSSPLGILQNQYNANDCRNVNSSSSIEAKTICQAISYFATADSGGSLTLVTPSRVGECDGVSTADKPNMIQWLQSTYPDLKILVLQFPDGGQGTLDCPRDNGNVKTVDLGPRGAFSEALDLAFDAVKTTDPSPAAVCSGLGSFPTY